MRTGIALAIAIAVAAFWFGRSTLPVDHRTPADPAATSADVRSEAKVAAQATSPAADAPSLRDATKASRFRETVPVEAISGEYPFAFDVALTIEPPAGSALDALHRFDAAAKQGDAHAAYMMYQSIDRCQEVRIAGQMRELEKSKGNAVEYQRLLSRNETTLKECEGIGPEEIALGYEGLRIAAERGDIVAQLHYPAIAYDEFPTTTDKIRSAEKLVEFRENAMRYLTSAAGRGSIQAMRMLAGAYMDGVLTQPDFSKSYTYTFAAYLLDPGPATQSFVEEAAKNLTTEQAGVAQQQARQLLDRCCKR